MKHLITAILLLLLLACNNKTEKKEQVQLEVEKPAKVEMLADNQLRYLELSGTPYERGLTHGTLLKKEIHEVIQFLKDDIKESTGQDPDAYISSFLESTHFEASIAQYTPELIEELKGISDGSEIDYNTLLMHQLPDEYWIDKLALQMHKCSSFGVDKSVNNPSMTAQNMDIPTYYHGYQTVIKIKEDSGKQMMFLTIPGFLGLTGMNNKDVSVNVNTLLHLANNNSGLPVTFMVRGLVSKETQEEAINFLLETAHASGQNYIIGGPEKVYDFECSANEKVAFRPFNNAMFTYHTNFPLANKDYNQTMVNGVEQFGITWEESMTCERYPSFEKRFTKETTNITVEDIKEVLSSRDNDGRDVVSNESTYASIIYVLSNNPEFIIAPGKPHEVGFIVLNFE
ncbi:C45 family autoproteolytic acyltransferase/hydolase [Formosa maritima]|uniref:Peptidase C45 hydrolase domain-containing protein n=1 Tax=Formosa maritima TaxID=2592046 RepID=A0A5D0G8Q2_9FLAO|nr:C45 family peptidase [Formosa maritima]TYA55285.1 hypothetical protein FVF61_07525 [Formosa maritima]